MAQEELASRVGANRHTIMAIEAGKYAPSSLLAFRIAAALGSRLEDVFSYARNEPGRRG